MRAYLVRHAEARSEQEDPKKSLSEVGVANIGKVSNFISKRCDIQVATILHSGKSRAEETALILGKTIKPSEGVQEAKGLSPDDDISPWVERLEGATRDLMMVSHLPFLPRLADRLLCEGGCDTTVDFAPASVLCLRKDPLERWSIQWFLIPQILP